MKINAFNSAVLEGVVSSSIEIEATFTKGLPTFSIVGLASSDIQESKERIKSALLTNGFHFPPLRITINLSPSDLRKSGTHLDLPMALLIALYKESFKEGLFVFGELGLDGKVKTSSLLFPIILSLKEQGLIKEAIVPKDAMPYLSSIMGIKFIPISHLQDAIDRIKEDDFSTNSQTFSLSSPFLEINSKKYYYENNYQEDFMEVKGQSLAKRASLISASGMHNFFMEGSPGCGKSMIAKRLNYILPPLSEEEILTIFKHQFLDGKEPTLKANRPIRSPHHTATLSSIFGGGSIVAKIGEVALANKGILFFDELPYFHKNILEALREPLQNNQVNISRVNAKISYDADVMFISAQNPCPCGNLLSKKSCHCTDLEIKRYKNKLSEPFLDRIDIFVTMQDITQEDKGDISSKGLHKKVLEVFKIQKERGQENLNGKLNEKEIEKFCTLNIEAQNILEKAIDRFTLSHRSIASIKKVARTIADINQNREIQKIDILEALNYRRR